MKAIYLVMLHALCGWRDPLWHAVIHFPRGLVERHSRSAGLQMSAMQRAAVVAEARSWIGTPYHHAADVKGHGVDCALLLVRVYCDLGLVEPFDPRPYTRDWFLHRSEERYLGFPPRPFS